MRIRWKKYFFLYHSNRESESVECELWPLYGSRREYMDTNELIFYGGYRYANLPFIVHIIFFLSCQLNWVRRKFEIRKKGYTHHTQTHMKSKEWRYKNEIIGASVRKKRKRKVEVLHLDFFFIFQTKFFFGQLLTWKVPVCVVY